MPDPISYYYRQPTSPLGQAMSSLSSLVETLYQIKLNQEAREAMQEYRQATLKLSREDLAERARVNKSLIELRQKQGIALGDRETPEAKFVREQNLRDLTRQADDYVTMVTKVYRDEKGVMQSLPGAPAPTEVQERSAMEAMRQLQEAGYTGYNTYLDALEDKYPKGKEPGEVPSPKPPPAREAGLGRPSLPGAALPEAAGVGARQFTEPVRHLSESELEEEYNRRAAADPDKANQQIYQEMLNEGLLPDIGGIPQMIP